MGIKHKVAAVNRIGKTPEERSMEMRRRATMGWNKLSIEEKNKRMLKVRKNRWKNKTIEERKEHRKKMLLGKLNKKNGIQL